MTTDPVQASCPEARARRAGFALVLLAAVVLVGWAMELETLQSVVPGWPSMKANTALCFLLGGAALIGVRRRTRTARLAATAAAVAITAIASATLVQHVAAVDLRIDELLFHDPDTARVLHPGRMAEAAAIGFVFAGVGLLLAGVVRRHPWAVRLARALAGGAIVIGAAGIVGYVLRLSFLYTWYGFGFVALHTAAAFVLMGFGIASVTRVGEPVPRRPRDDERIVRTSAVLLVLAASAIGISGIVALEAQIQRLVEDELRNLLDEQVTEIRLNVELRRGKAALVASRPGLRSVVARLAAAPDDQRLRRDAERRLESFRAHGFSAVAAVGADGQELARAGTLISAPAVAFPAGPHGDATLLWHAGLFLRHRFAIDDGVLAYIVTEQPLERLNRLLVSNQTGYRTAEFLLCSPAPGEAECFPSRTSPAPLSAASMGPASLVSRAAHAFGTATALDHRGQRVIAAYGPLSDLGLVAALKIDLDEAYAPLRRQLALAVALVASVTAGGVLLMRHRVRPLAAGLEARVRERSAELEQASARLGEHQARLAAIVESAMDGVIAVGTDQRIVMFNAAAEAMFRCPAAAALGRPLDQFLPPAERASHRDHLREFASAGLTARRMGRLGSVSGVRADGQEFPIEASISRVTVGSDILLTAILRDITERRRAEDAHRIFSERLQALHEIDRSILAAETSQQTAQGALDRLCAMLALPRATVAEYDVAGRRGRWLAVAGASRAAIREGQTFPLELMGDLDALGGGRVQTLTVCSMMHLPAARELASLGLHAYAVVPLIVEGELIGSLNVACPDGIALEEASRQVIREVADQLAIAMRHARLREQIVSHAHDLEREVAQRTRELADANAELCRANDRLRETLTEIDTARREQIETKDRFLSHVSHELRAPLTAIYQFSTILQDGIAGALSADQRDCVEVLVRNAEQLRGMIDDLLEATRADMAILTLRRQRRVSVVAVVDDVLQTLQPAASEKDVRLVGDLPSDLPPVEADAARVRQILVNLVDNAIKFSSAGHAVRVTGVRPAETPEFLRISVIDEGPGLTDEDRRRVFNRLYQVPGPDQTARDGLGLGLYICKELVQRHGGRIWADTNIGRGSTFSFTLPIDPGFREPGARRPQPVECST